MGSGAAPGAHWFDIPSDVDSDGAVDIGDYAALFIDQFTFPNGWFGFGNATIQQAGAFGHGSVCLVDISDLSILINAPSHEFIIDYQYTGAPTNVQVNSAPLYVGPLAGVPHDIAPGVTASIFEIAAGPQRRGRLTLQSTNFDIDPFVWLTNVRIGGDTITFDNIRVYSTTNTNDCAADFNGDGTANSGDFFDFLIGFFAGNADFNNDGTTTSQDFFDFLSAFFNGCP